MARTVKPSFCRVCHNSCAILVEVEDGRVVGVTGDDDNPLYAGYSCLKGRQQAELYEPANRLLATQKRQPDGTYVDYPYEDAVREIAERLQAILAAHGSRAIANYMATLSFFTHPATYGLSTGFMDAIGATMRFSPATIDQPGKNIAAGFHGRWMAPLQKFNDIDALVLFGSNPLVSYQGFPIGNPNTFLRDFKDRGGKLVVVDPRRSEVARRADIHLQPKPGHDAGILAAMLHVVLEEDLLDHAFVAEEVNGVEALRKAVSDMTPAAVGERAGVDAADITAAAHVFARARRSTVTAGTGPNMSGGGSLVEYLVLCLATLCGRWMRAGEVDVAADTWLPSHPRAQAQPPRKPYDLGERMRVRGLSENLAGMPTAAAADEMLLEGEGQIRALISCGGNPVLTWPDQQRTVAAFEQLDLLVQVDAAMSATAQMADYVIAVKRALEMPGFTAIPELIGYLDNYGLPASHAQYTDAIVEPPEGSALVEDWEFFYDLARHMGLKINLAGKHIMLEAETVELDMDAKPDGAQLLEAMTSCARVPLAEIKAHPHGAFFPEPQVVVAPKEEGWEGRLDAGNVEMLTDLGAYWAATAPSEGGFEMRLISRRNPNVHNTATDDPWRKRTYNPVYLHADDMARLALAQGDQVRLSSPRGSIYAIVDRDDNMRPGVASMSHGFGTTELDPQDVSVTGSNTGALIDNAIGFDRYSGQPMMSNIPIRIEPL